MIDLLIDWLIYFMIDLLIYWLMSDSKWSFPTEEHKKMKGSQMFV